MRRAAVFRPLHTVSTWRFSFCFLVLRWWATSDPLPTLTQENGSESSTLGGRRQRRWHREREKKVPPPPPPPQETLYTFVHSRVPRQSDRPEEDAMRQPTLLNEARDRHYYSVCCCQEEIRDERFFSSTYLS